MTFAAYTGDIGRAIAWGGRYDNVGRDFGRERAATGFSADLKTLIGISPLAAVVEAKIFAPAGTEPGLLDKIEELRREGNIVVQALPGQTGGAAEMGCSEELISDGGTWQRRAI